MTPSEQLAGLLADVQRPHTAFYAAGQLHIPPLLSVEGVGVVAFPLLPQQTEALAAVAEPAPYGRGPETLVDPEVRRCMQIGPEQITLTGAHWSAAVEEATRTIQARLAVEGEVRAELYKLLLYQPGDFFLPHRDSEKADGMFGTLLFVLPSPHEGGELLIEHAGQQVHLPLQASAPFDVPYAAFYADCTHELRPVTSGARLCLVYNLVCPSPQLPTAPEHHDIIAQLAELLSGWAEGWPDKLCYVLEHDYTEHSISFPRLKGADAARAAALKEAATQADCELYVGLISIREQGGAVEKVWSAAPDNPGDWEIYEDTAERRTTVELHSDTEGHPALLQKLQLDEATETSPPKVLDAEDFDKVRFWEASGNEGGSFERSYRRAALVVWPRQRTLAVAQKMDRRDAAMSIADALRREHPLGVALARQHLQVHHANNELMQQIISHGEPSLVRALLKQLAEEKWPKLDERIPSIIATVTQLPLVETAPLLRAMVRNRQDREAAECAALLHHLAAVLEQPPEGAALIHELLLGLLDRLQSPQPRPVKMTRTITTHLLAAVVLNHDQEGRERIIEAMLGRGDIWRLQSHLMRALLELIDKFGTALVGMPAIQRLREACERPIRARIAQDLTPPPDHVSPETFPPHCGDCRDLKAYLTDPWKLTWSFKANKARREHLEERIRRARVDVETQTLQKGNPFTLVVQKPTENYDRRVAQRQDDLRVLDKLRVLDGLR